MIVHKFGGTSVGDASRFTNVAGIVLEHHTCNDHGAGSTAIVVSAMSGVTDRLITGARAAAEGNDSAYRQIKSGLLQRHLECVESLLTRSQERLAVGGLVEDRLHELERVYRSIALLGECTARGYDAVSSVGEHLSASILAAALRERGARAEAVSAVELVVTDATHGAASPHMEATRRRLQERVKPMIERGTIPVITGYIGATEAGVTTTLGRGGSDFSAALVGAGLDAGEVWIWSDVDGILTADPNVVPQARTLAELSYEEAATLAYVGAEVLHPSTLRPVVERGIPLRLLNTFRPAHPGTRIVGTPAAGRVLLPAIISASGLTLVAIGSRDDSWALPMAAHALKSLSEARVRVLMFSQSFSEHSLNLVVREQDQGHCLGVLRHHFGQQAGEYDVEIKEKVATISVVGVPGWNGNGIVSHTFAALGACGTRVIAVAQAATEHTISFCIPESQMADTVRFLHRELGMER